MSAQPALTPVSPSQHRLDKALFWLRWLFLIGMVLLALLAEESLLGSTDVHQTKLLLSLGLGAGINVMVGLITLNPQIEDQMLGLLSAVLDSLLAAMFCWAYEGSLVPLFLLGTLAIVTAALRLGWIGAGITTGTVAIGSLLAIAQTGTYNSDQWLIWLVSIGFLFAFGALGVIFRSGGTTNGAGSNNEAKAEYEAQRLRATRERAQAIFDMTTALSASLDHRQVLNETQNIGMLGLREHLGEKVRLVSAVMLFQGNDNQLRIVTGRGLTRKDQALALPGRRGVLGLALKQAEPVFSGDPARDPELRYFMGFHDIQSILAIPLRAGIDVYGVMIFGCDKPNAFSDDHVELMTAIGTQSTVSLQNAVLYQNLKTEKEKIVEIEEESRKKLSRDLHDGPTQSVAAIAMRVNYIRRLIERQPQQAVEELWKVEELARRTTKEIRHMLFTLRPLVLETQGLLAALAQLAEKMEETYDTNVVLQALPDVEHYLDTNSQGVLFYVVEEAVNNARKHAKSQQINVRLYHRDHQYVVVEIEDDGKGFDVEAVDKNYDQRGSLGMINMRERAELIEGTARVQSAPGRGTKITVIVPVQAGGAVTSDESEEPIPPLNLQSHREGARTAQEQPETSTQPEFTLPETGKLTAPPTLPTPPESTSRPTSPAPASKTDSKPASPSRPSSPAQPSAPPAQPSQRPTPPPSAAPANSFASGGLEKKIDRGQKVDTQEMKSANDYGQMFDSFANGGFTQPNQAKPTAKSGDNADQAPQKRQIKRLGRAKRSHSKSRPKLDAASPPDNKPQPEE